MPLLNTENFITFVLSDLVITEVPMGAFGWGF